MPVPYSDSPLYYFLKACKKLQMICFLISEKNTLILTGVDYKTSQVALYTTYPLKIFTQINLVYQGGRLRHHSENHEKRAKNNLCNTNHPKLFWALFLTKPQQY